MYLQEVVLSRTSPQLSHGLDEWPTLNITNGSAELDDTGVRLFVCVIDRDSGHTFNPILHGVCEVGDNLYGPADVVASPLTFNDMLVDLSRCDVVFPSQCDVQVTFVVAQVKIDFPPIVKNKDLPMPASLLAVGSIFGSFTMLAYSVGAIVPASTFM